MSATVLDAPRAAKGSRAERAAIALAILGWVVSFILVRDTPGWDLETALIVAIPVGVSFIPLFGALIQRNQPARVVATVLLLVCVVLGLFSVGYLYLPATIAMGMAAWTGHSHR